MSNRKNLANGILALGVSDTDTTWVLQNGYGAGMPDVPFYLTATPFGQLSTMGNSEIVNVTARTTDTLTVQRGAKGTTAKAFAAGAVVSNGIYDDEKWGSDNIDFKTLVPYSGRMPVVTFTAVSNWSFQNVGSPITIENLIIGAEYLVVFSADFVQTPDGSGEFGWLINTSSPLSCIQYSPMGSDAQGVNPSRTFIATSETHTLQRIYRGGNAGSSRFGNSTVVVMRVG